MKRKKLTKKDRLPKASIEEVRRIRQGEEHIDRGNSLYKYKSTSLGTECSICGEIGQHECIPLMQAYLEENIKFKEYCWRIFIEMENIHGG